MSKRVLFLTLSFAALAGLAGPGLATPPDIITVRDELFGIADDSVLLLRYTRDNLGTYDAEHQDVFLVSVDRGSGAETLFPVYRTHTRLEAGQAGPTARTIGGNAPGSINPFDVLRQRQGSAIGASGGHRDGTVALRGGRASVSYADGVVVDIETADLVRRAGASLDRLAESIEDYGRLAPLSVQDLLAGRSHDVASCQFLEPVHFGDWRYPGSPARLLRVTCGEEGEVASILLLLLEAGVPAASPPR